MKTKDFTDKQWNDLLVTQMSKIDEVDLVVLRGHTLLEYLLNHFIEKTNQKVEVDVERIQFSTKAKIFSVFCPNEFDERILLLNRIRNDIAHRLEVRKELFKEFFHRDKEDFENGIDSYTPVDVAGRVIHLLGAVHRRIQLYFNEEKIKEELYIEYLKNEIVKS